MLLKKPRKFQTKVSPVNPGQFRQPEILTFDELYERARFIVEHTESSEASTENDDDDIPF